MILLRYFSCSSHAQIQAETDLSVRLSAVSLIPSVGCIVCLETLLMRGVVMLIITACIFLVFNQFMWSCHIVQAVGDLW